MIKYELKKYSAQTGLIKAGAKKPDDYFRFANENDTDAETIKEFKTKEEALSALALYTNVCNKVEGFAGSFYEVIAYAVEKNEYDEEGEWIDGGDMWSADDRNE